MTATPSAAPDLLRPGEVAHLFRVDVKTVWRWHAEGKIPADQIVTTPSGRSLYRGGYIRSLLGGAR